MQRPRVGAVVRGSYRFVNLTPVPVRTNREVGVKELAPVTLEASTSNTYGQVAQELV